MPWFAAADTNKDGQLSKAEFDAAKGPMHGGRAMAVRVTAPRRSRSAEFQCSD
jgi:hypothetical protein